MGHTLTIPCIVKSQQYVTLSDTYDKCIENSYRDFKDLIEEYLGYEAVKWFESVLESAVFNADNFYYGDDYEAISDSLRRLAIDTMNDLREVVYGEKRLNRKRLEEIIERLDNEL